MQRGWGMNNCHPLKPSSHRWCSRRTLTGSPATPALRESFPVSVGEPVICFWSVHYGSTDRTCALLCMWLVRKILTLTLLEFLSVSFCLGRPSRLCWVRNWEWSLATDTKKWKSLAYSKELSAAHKSGSFPDETPGTTAALAYTWSPPCEAVGWAPCYAVQTPDHESVK